MMKFLINGKQEIWIVDKNYYQVFRIYFQVVMQQGIILINGLKFYLQMHLQH